MNININNAMGGNSGKAITGTSAVVPDAGKTWCVLKPISTDMVVSAITCSITDVSSLLPMTVVIGDVFLCPGITSVTLSSGQGIGYNS